MSVLEDRLWQELAHDHRDALAYDIVALPQRRRRLPALAAAAAVLAAALVLAALWLGGRHSEPAYAVTQHQDGTVTITIRRLIGVQGADASLARLGVPVRTISYETGCKTRRGEYTLAKVPHEQVERIRRLVRAHGEAGVEVDPAAIPAGDTLVLAAAPVGKGTVALSAELYRGAAPPCLPLKPGRAR